MWKIILPVVLAIGLFAGGFYIGRGNKEVEIREIRTKGETVTKIVDRIVTVTRTVHPDGTVEEKTTTENKDTNIKDKEKSTDRDSLTSSNTSNYSLGVHYWIPLSSRILDPETYSIKAVDVSIGRRLIGDIWVDGSYRFNGDLALGIRLQF
jgi:hypothetical protein